MHRSLRAFHFGRHQLLTASLFTVMNLVACAQAPSNPPVWLWVGAAMLWPTVAYFANLLDPDLQHPSIKEAPVLVSVPLPAPQEAVEVSLPLYRKIDLSDDHGDYATFFRVDGTPGAMREVSIRLSNGNTVEVEVNPNYRFDRSSRDFLLGQGRYACTAAEFHRAREAALTFLNSAW